MKSVELFSGAGGLALGISESGFKHLAIVEWDHDSCETVRANQAAGFELIQSWPVHEMDVRQFDFRTISGEVDLLAGGPPCQPFSLAGKHRGHQDERNMFPEVFRAARVLRPKAVLIENVKGLARPSFREYLDYILLQLSLPEVTRRPNEEWPSHAARLTKERAKVRSQSLAYDVQVKLVNSADYGVPQKRERVIIVGFRQDLGVKWDYPAPTHSLDALLYDQWVTGEYWERHRISKKQRPESPERYRAKIETMRSSLLKPVEKPWVTVRDAISDLPDPETYKGTEWKNHVFNPGARSYPGHTGSPWDEPAKTLKAGDHGVPGGENMLRHLDGSVRYFTVRESARLQTFPDGYEFKGAWSENMRQLGNAVPMKLAKVMSEQIRNSLANLTDVKPRRQGSNRGPSHREAILHPVG